MGSRLKNWLTQKIGLNISMKPDEFGSQIKDGTIIAKILYHHGIIPARELEYFLPTDKPKLCRVNMNKIKSWLALINVKCEQDFIDKISEGNGPASLQLIYILYLCFEKDKKTLLSTACERELLQKPMKFDTQPRQDKTPGEEFRNLHDKRKSLINFYRDRQERFIEKCKYGRLKFAETLQLEALGKQVITKERPKNVEETGYMQKAIGDFEDKYNLKPVDTDTILTEVLPKTLSLVDFPYHDSITKLDVEKFVDKLQRRERRKIVYRDLRKPVEKMTMAQLWDKIIEQQQKEIDYTTAKKILEKSQFEKKLAVKLFQLKQVKSDLRGKRIAHEEHVLLQREEELVRRLMGNEEEEVEGEETLEEFELQELRELELHRLLREKRKWVKHEQNRMFCMDIASDLIDFALQAVFYKETVPDHIIPEEMWQLWTEQFLRSEPIYRQIAPCKQKSSEEEDFARFLEEAKRMENEYKNEFLGCDIHDHLFYKGAWNILEDPPPKTNTILTHIIYRLFDIIYPPPIPPQPADVPKFLVAGLIIGIEDERAIKALQEILVTQNVHLLTLPKIVSSGFEAYKHELGKPLIVDPEIKSFEDTRFPIDYFIPQKPDKKGAKTPDKKGKPDTDDHTHPTAHKLTQVPSDELLVELTPLAKLGRAAFEKLCEGEILEEELLVKIFISYLHTLTNTNGWMLANYPSRWEETKYLEEVMTGREIEAPKFETDTLHEDDTNVPSTYGVPVFFDEFGEEIFGQTEPAVPEKHSDTKQEVIKHSIFFDHPNPPPPEENYRSFLRTFIEVTEMEEDFETKKKKMLVKLQGKEGVSLPQLMSGLDAMEEEGEGSLSEIDEGSNSNQPRISNIEAIPLLSEEEGSESLSEEETSIDESIKSHEYLQLFYDDQNIYQQFVLSAYDFLTIKELAKIILEDVTSDFTEIDAMEDPTAVADKKKGKSGGTTETKTTERMSERASHQEEESETTLTGIKADSKIFSEVIQPGEPGWEYVSVSLPDDMITMLFRTWMSNEDDYFETLKRCVAYRQPHLIRVSLWINHTKIHFKQFLYRPDRKQEIVTKFQTIFNKKLSQPSVTKNCLISYVNDLQNVLWEHCDLKKTEAEDRRKGIIKDGWIMDEMINLTNIYLDLIQALVNINTAALQLFYDYYLLTLGGFIKGTRLGPVTIPKLIFTSRQAKEEELRKKRIESQARRRHKIITEPKEIVKNADVGQIKSKMKKLLRREEKYSITTSPCHEMILKAFNIATTAVEASAIYFRDVLTIEESEIETRERNKNVKRCYSNMFKEKPIGYDLHITKDIIIKICSEWRAGFEKEIVATMYRLHVIKNRALADLTDILEQAQSLFLALLEDTNSMYVKEMTNVDLLCDILFNVIEQRTPLEADLILQGDEFYMRSKSVVYPRIYVHLGAIQSTDDSYFQRDNILKLHSILSYVAPKGYIKRKALQYIIEDVILCWDDEEIQPFPGVWSQLASSEVSAILEQVYGNLDYMRWIDFLIYSLDLSYPTQRQLLRTLKRFLECDPDRTGNVDCIDYLHVVFWFEEKTLDEDGDIILNIPFKEILCYLFHNNELINYINLLHCFSKHTDPVQGFANAAAVHMGQAVNLYPSEEEDNYTCGEIDGIKVTSKVPLSTGLLHIEKVETEEEEVAEEEMGDVEDQEDSIDIILGPKSSFFSTELTDQDSKLPKSSMGYTPRTTIDMPEFYTDEQVDETVAEEEEEKIAQRPLYYETLPEEIEEEEEVEEEEEITVRSSKSWLIKASEIPLETLFAVLTTSLPWMDPNDIKSELELIYSQEDSLLTTAVTQCNFINNVLRESHSFKALYLTEIVNNVKKLRQK